MNAESGDALLEAARRRGRLAAEAFELRLRERESRERRELLARQLRPAASTDHLGARTADDEPTVVWLKREVLRLEREVEALRAFNRAVQRSRAWRIVQLLRRMVGRAW